MSEFNKFYRCEECGHHPSWRSSILGEFFGDVEIKREGVNVSIFCKCHRCGHIESAPFQHSYFNKLDYSIRMEFLREEIFKKYGEECMNPECRSTENLQIDHIRPKSKYPEEALNIDNLQVLCKVCHGPKRESDSEEWNFKKLRLGELSTV